MPKIRKFIKKHKWEIGLTAAGMLVAVPVALTVGPHIGIAAMGKAVAGTEAVAKGGAAVFGLAGNRVGLAIDAKKKKPPSK